MRGSNALAFAVAASIASTTFAVSTTYYNATTRRLAPGTTPPRAYFYNPGPDNAGEAGHILFDDVTYSGPGSPPLPMTLFNVTRITFGISRSANAPAVQITPYYAQLHQDAQAFGGIGDGPNYDVLSPTPIAGVPVSLPINGASHVETEITFGDGVHTLFNVPGAFASPDTAYRSFAAGLQFSTVTDENGWTVASYTDNLDVLWDYESNASFSEFTYGADSTGLIYGTQYIKVEGLVLSGVAGDASIDGQVDITDLGLLATNWQQAGDYTNGDFNFDNFVDITDLGILATNWQVGVSGPSLNEALAEVGLGGVSIPEPGALALAPLSLLILRRRRD